MFIFCSFNRYLGMGLKDEVANRIKSLRMSKRLSREELARMTNISASGLVQMESGERWPRPENIEALAEALGVPWRYFYQDEKSIEAALRLIASELGVAIEIPKSRQK